MTEEQLASDEEWEADRDAALETNRAAIERFRNKHTANPEQRLIDSAARASLSNKPRWQALIENGASDQAIKELLGNEFGIGGGGGGPLTYQHSYRGGVSPSLTIYIDDRRKPVMELHGKKLIDYVRGLLAIPQDGGAFQHAMF